MNDLFVGDFTPGNIIINGGRVHFVVAVAPSYAGPGKIYTFDVVHIDAYVVRKSSSVTAHPTREPLASCEVKTCTK